MTPCHMEEKIPKEVFYNLTKEKQEKIIFVFKEAFEAKPFQKVNVKEIVEKAGIARSSFYQYFKNLEDAYFTILNKETVDIHKLFMKMFLFEALIAHGHKIADILFDENTYMIYKNRYLY